MAGSGGHRPADRHATGAAGGRGGQRHADDGPADDRRLAAGDAVRAVAAVLVGQRTGRCDPGQLADRRPLGRRPAVRRTVARRARPVRHLRVVGAVRRVLLAVIVLGGAVALIAPTASAAPHTEDVPPPSQRVYVVSDSVGLGAKNAIPAAFPPDWQVTVDGTPALFVEQLLSKHVQAREAAQPWVLGDFVVVAGG